MQSLLPISALLLGVALLMTGLGLQNIMLPVRASLEGFGAFEIGVMGSCYFAGYGAGCIYGARLVKNVGHIRTFTAMTAIASTTVLAHAFVIEPQLWWIFRAGSGFCFAVLYMVIESWLNERSTRETRGFVLSAYMIINYLVLTIGQLMLPLFDSRTFDLFAIVSILISLAAVPVALTRASAPAPIHTTKLRLLRLYRVSPVGVAGCLVVGLTIGTFWSLAPLFGATHGWSEISIAIFMSVTVIGGALGQWPLGLWSDRGDRRWIIVFAASVAVISGLLLWLDPFTSDLALFICGAVWGATAYPLYSLAIAHTNDFSEPTDFVETSSGLLLVFAAGAVVGPMVVSAAAVFTDASVLYGCSALMHAGLVVFTIARMMLRKAAPPEHHVDFADAFKAAQTVSAVFDEQIQTELEAEAELEAERHH